MFQITYQDVLYVNKTPAELLETGVPIAMVGAALKERAIDQIKVFAETNRNQLATVASGKLAEYRIKEEIARDPDAASATELDLLSREAKARGTNRTGLIGQINAQAAAYRQTALLIGALEAEAVAAIAAIADDHVDIEAQIEAVMIAKKAEAEMEFVKVKALIGGN